MHRERERAGLRDGRAFTGLRLQERVDLRLEVIDLLDDRREDVVVDQGLEDEPALVVEPSRLLVRESPERWLVVGPRERRVPRVRHRDPHGAERRGATVRAALPVVTAVTTMLPVVTGV